MPDLIRRMWGMGLTASISGAGYRFHAAIAVTHTGLVLDARSTARIDIQLSSALNSDVSHSIYVPQEYGAEGSSISASSHSPRQSHAATHIRRRN